MNGHEFKYKCDTCGKLHFYSFPLTDLHPKVCTSAGCPGVLQSYASAPMTIPILGSPAFITKDKKPSLTLLAPKFLVAMAEHMQKGLKNGRKRDDWKKLVWDAKTRTMYHDALLRHALNGDMLAVACNCMIIWYNDHKLKTKDCTCATDTN